MHSMSKFCLRPDPAFPVLSISADCGAFLIRLLGSFTQPFYMETPEALPLNVEPPEIYPKAFFWGRNLALIASPFFEVKLPLHQPATLAASYFLSFSLAPSHTSSLFRILPHLLLAKIHLHTCIVFC